MENPFIQPKTLVRQATQYVAHNQLVVDGLPETIQDLCLEERFSLLKDFMVTSGSVVIREMNQYDDDDMSFETVKNGKYKVYCSSNPWTLYTVHSDWFERPDLRLENLSDVLSEQNWIERGAIFVERGYIGVLEFEQTPDDKSSFETFYQKCHEEIDVRRKSYYYVSKIGVVSDVAQGGHEIFTLKNKNDETIGIKICLEDCGDLSDYY